MIKNVINEMINYYNTDIKRINHFMKVYAFAKFIGENEALDKKTQEILEVTAIVHDIGIKISEEKYGSSDGKYQEKEGPAIAEKLLTELGYDKEFTDRVCYIIAHHHTYDNIDGIDYQILVEADFIVNLYEDSCSPIAVKSAYNKIFKTKSGKNYVEKMFMGE